MTNSFFNSCERIDDRYFKYFNDKVDWFKEINRNGDLDRIDWTCVNRTGTTTNCELKLRDNHINQYDDVYIEVDKYKHLMKRWKENKEIPLYINFFQDEKHVAVWDLRKVNKMNFYPFARIYNKGKQRWEEVERYGLFPRDSMFYIYDYNEDKYIRQWQEEYQKQIRTNQQTH